jgi:hypothetical protein
LAKYFSDKEEDYLDRETAISKPEASTLNLNQNKSGNKDKPRIDPTFMDFLTSKDTREASFKGTVSKTNQVKVAFTGWQPYIPPDSVSQGLLAQSLPSASLWLPCSPQQIT